MKEKLFLLLVVIGLTFPYPIISLLINHKLLLGIVAGITGISFLKEVIRDGLENYNG